MIRVVVCGLILAVSGAGLAAAAEVRVPQQRGLIDRSYRDADGDHKYVVFVPQGEPPQDGWPVILFLHGAGERGTDGRRQLAVGLGPLVKLRAANFPAVVVFPQAENFNRPILRTWSPFAADGRRALAMLADVERDYPVNSKRRILSGWSMGAVGAWEVAAADPSHWSAVTTVSGGGRPEVAARLRDVPIWAFHGADDRIVPAATTRQMVQAIRNAGGRILFSEIAGEGHDVWRRVYDSDVVLNWMLAPEPNRPELESLTLPPDRTHAEQTPFTPAMVIERAMTVRLGQTAMDIIATGLPAALEADSLSGRLEDVNEDMELDGRTFKVRFGNLTYAAELERAIIRAYGPDRVQAEVGLRNIKLHVGRISVTDGSVGFTAGPAEVVVGHRQPVWLRIEARPAIDKQRLALKPLRTSFEIPDYNWFVREPQGIRLQGNWLTEEEVKTAVVGGIYFRRETIEQQVRSAVPSLLDRFGDSIDLTPLEEMVAALWPLPVYRPEVRVVPESISTDAAGVSMTFSVAVASIDATAPPSPKKLFASAPPAFQVGQTTDLRVGIAVDVLDHISSLLAGSEAARIFTTDIPERPFVELVDRKMLAEVLPSATTLATAQGVETALSLAAPLRLRPLDASRRQSQNGIGILIEAPRLDLDVSTVSRAQPDKLPASVQPKPVAHRTIAAPSGDAAESLETGRVHAALNSGDVETLTAIFHGELSLTQPLSLEPVVLEHGRMGLKMVWESAAEIRATGDARVERDGPEGTAADEGMARLFSRGWERWTEEQAAQISVLPEVAFGSAAMTLRELAWVGTQLTVAFAPAPTRIVNATEAGVTYQVRGPYSRWSETRTLAAGQSQSFAAGTEIHLRPLRDWEFDEIAMPAGSVWECRSPDHGRKLEWVRTDTDPQLPVASE
ncbi:MAG: hypothetical protein KF861_11970 [Planctomycetaceae bacterium]|nr:hypothetical protein [Planctomycetaceae bacterium]